MVDDLTDAQIPANTAQHVCILCAQTMSLSEQINHSAHRILRGFHEIRADPCRYIISLGVKVPADGSMRDTPREAQIAAFDVINVRLYAHGRLNCGSADLTISLCSVGVSDREQGTLHLDRE